jgi:phage major head subunit gpT-like protein
MPAVTPSFVIDLETRMRARTENAYATLNVESWWQKITKVEKTESLKDIIFWLISSAQLRDQGTLGGNMHFADQTSVKFEYENKFSGEGLRLRRQQLEDLDGMGIELASSWSRDIGEYMSYWPQKLVTHVLKNGHTASLYTGYDGKALFATDHPNNPNNTGLGTYSNSLSGAGTYDISTAVTADVALVNLGKVFAKFAEVKMPNGEDPRNIRPAFLLCGPTLFPRAADERQGFGSGRYRWCWRRRRRGADQGAWIRATRAGARARRLRVGHHVFRSRQGGGRQRHGWHRLRRARAVQDQLLRPARLRQAGPNGRVRVAVPRPKRRGSWATVHAMEG